MNYLLWLLGISVFVAALERLWPARPQAVFRRWLWSDALHLIFNGHFLGLLLYAIALQRILPVFDGWIAEQGLTGLLYRGAVADWPLVVQALVAVVVIDFVQWLVHNALHRVGFLWRFHQVHHSVKDGEMDWIVSFRFSWWEPVFYKTVTYLPAAWFGFAPEAMFFHAVFGTLIGHLNHANLTWDYGPLRYVLNSPRMHLYHHDFEAPKSGQNFGIIFSCWDWIFGTAHLPDAPPAHIGFPGVERLPQDFFGHLAWPIPLVSQKLDGTRGLVSLMGLAVLGLLMLASRPPVVATPMFGEPAASSQPAGQTAVALNRPSGPSAATANLERFGTGARAAGWSRPDVAVSAVELAEALGSPQLVLLDVRTPERFEVGHIPSSQLVERGDYSGGAIPGVSLDRSALQAMLRQRGVSKDSTVVILGDGGPEPYRLWWTLHEVGGLNSRVLDGGLDAWKGLGERLAMGPGWAPEPGDVELPGGPARHLMWDDVARLQEQHPDLQLVDTRSADEFTGVEHHKKAARPGHIPGARHLLWTDVLELRDGAPMLRSPDGVRAVLGEHGIQVGVPLLTYCQSGTRSSAVYYAAIQAGHDPDTLWNYDGSWAEYSRLDLPVAMGEAL